MGLLDEIDAQGRPGGLRHKVAVLLDGMQDPERKELLEALADTQFTNAQIARALRARGHNVSDSAVRAYRMAAHDSR